MLRLLGASTAQWRWIVAAESLLASLLGVLLAIGTFHGLRLLGPLVLLQGRSVRVSDLTPDALFTAAILLGVPLLATLAAISGARQAAVGPLGCPGASPPPARVVVAARTARSHWYLNLAHPGKRFRLARGRILQDGPANTLVAAGLATLLAGVIAMMSLLTPPTLFNAANNVS